jgi:hypothetical protein
LRFSIAFVLALMIPLLARPGIAAGPGDKEAYQGMNAAKGGFCARAIPLLEGAESQRHRPSSALALADCYAKRNELVKASKLYHAIAAEKKKPGYNARDIAAIPAAKKKAVQIDARIPTLVVAPKEPYKGLEVEINGEPVSNPTSPQQIEPRVLVTVVVRAEGHDEYTERIQLKDKERRVLKPRLKLKAGTKKPPAEAPRTRPVPGTEPREAPEKESEEGLEKAPEKELEQGPEKAPQRAKRGTPSTWIGAGYQGFVIPKFLFGLAGDGGSNVVAPGGDVSLTTRLGRFDLVFSIAYTSFGLGDTPFKPSGHPDTDYEIISSDLQALQASARLVWDVPLDARQTFSFRVGAGIGVGWTFLGDLYRTQAYPKNLVAGDPYTYVKCRGPNNPAGSFRYCNQLDYDANHYNGYVEPDWFTQPKGLPRGVRPLIYPWAVLPELGLSYHPSETIAVDLKVGASVTGFLTGIGVRYAL